MDRFADNPPFPTNARRKRNSKLSCFKTLLKEHFPQGFRPLEKGDLERMNQLAQKEFGRPIFEGDLRRARKALTLTERSGATLIRKETYVDPSYGPILHPEDLEELLTYVQNKGGVTSYANLFAERRDQLLTQGIDNQYALKSALIASCGKHIENKGHYFRLKGVENTFLEAKRDWLLKQKGFFNYQDFAAAFPGTPFITFNELARKTRGFLHLRGRGYIHHNRLGLDRSEKKRLSDLVDRLIRQSGKLVTNIDEVWESCSVMAGDVLEKVGIDNRRDLFNMLRGLFLGSFRFEYPLIFQRASLPNNFVLVKTEPDTPEA